MKYIKEHLLATSHKKTVTNIILQLPLDCERHNDFKQSFIILHEVKFTLQIIMFVFTGYRSVDLNLPP